MNRKYRIQSRINSGEFKRLSDKNNPANDIRYISEDILKNIMKQTAYGLMVRHKCDISRDGDKLETEIHNRLINYGIVFDILYVNSYVDEDTMDKSYNVQVEIFAYKNNSKRHVYVKDLIITNEEMFNG